MGVRLLVDRKGLAAALHARGVAIVEDEPRAIVVAAAVLAAAQQRFADTAVFALADDSAAEAAALDAGAADAACRDADDAVVAARVARLLRTGATLTVGELAIDRLARTARRAGRVLRLLPREYALLVQLAGANGEPVSRATLHRTLCGLSFDPGTNVVAVHVSRLRAELDRDAAFPMLLTERGRGYRLVATPLTSG